ncbi:MAG: hypothetical protein QOG05_5264, partial [Streptosporangiaceae bacterium]|nr:hypothetical protein [Streptosporangiaceae bacterium]
PRTCGGRDLCLGTVGAHRRCFRGRPRTGRGGSAFPGSNAEGGGLLSDTVYGRAWEKARQAALTPAEEASPLAERPYDLRHARLSTWLNAGVAPAQVAEWAGNSVPVLLRVYAKCLTDSEQTALRRIGGWAQPLLNHEQPPTPGSGRTPPDPDKRSPRPRCRWPGAVSAGGGRCWVRTSVG